MMDGGSEERWRHWFFDGVVKGVFWVGVVGMAMMDGQLRWSRPAMNGGKWNGMWRICTKWTAFVQNLPS